MTLTRRNIYIYAPAKQFIVCDRCWLESNIIMLELLGRLLDVCLCVCEIGIYGNTLHYIIVNVSSRKWKQRHCDAGGKFFFLSALCLTFSFYIIFFPWNKKPWITVVVTISFSFFYTQKNANCTFTFLIIIINAMRWWVQKILFEMTIPEFRLLGI